jgi:hypothetical protein
MALQVGSPTSRLCAVIAPGARTVLGTLCEGSPPYLQLAWSLVLYQCCLVHQRPWSADVRHRVQLQVAVEQFCAEPLRQLRG